MICFYRGGLIFPKLNELLAFWIFAWLLATGSSASAGISLDVSVSADQSSSAISTAPFSTASGSELLLAFIATDYLSGSNTTVTGVSGGGLNWTLICRTNVQSGTSEIWRAFAPSTLSAVGVTATLSQNVSASMTVMSFAGVDATGTNGSGAVGVSGTANSTRGAPAASLTTSRNGSWIVGVGNDFDNAIARTPGANQNLVHQYLTPSGDTYWVQRQSGPIPASGTVVGINDTAPSSDRYNLSICEVIPANAGGGQQTWSISGTVSPSSAGANASVALSGPVGATVTADSSGNYTFSNLPSGAYLVTPSQAGYSFTPASQTVSVVSANLSSLNFTGQALPSSVRFIQKSVNGNEATVSNISATYPSANTAGNLLVVTGTAARPHGTTTISDTAGNTYLPAIGPVVDLAQDVTGYIWYVPNCKGGANTVKLSPSSPDAMEIHISEFSGISKTSPLDQVASATGTGSVASSGAKATAASGELVFGYTFLFNTAGAGPGYSPMSLVNGDLDEYLVQPAAGSVAATFTQVSGTWFALLATFQPAGSSTVQPRSISGTISPSAIGAGTTLALSGGSVATLGADSSGNYTFSGLANGTYTVTPTQNGFTFTPASQSITINGADVTGINFAGQSSSASTWRISGTISPASAGAGATVGLSGGATATGTADSLGNYSFAGLANGTYIVTPARVGYIFSPGSQLETVNGANLTAVSFTAQGSSSPPSPLAVDTTTSTDGVSASKTISTSSFSTKTGNELLLAFVSTDYISGANTTVTGVSGGGLTWALVRRTNVQSGTSEIWRALATASLSGATVTATLSQSVVSSLTVMSFSGVDPSGTNGSGAIGATGTGSSGRGAPTASLVTTRNGAMIAAVGNDFDNAISRAPGANQRLIHQDLASIGDTYWVQTQTAPIPASGSVVTMNDTAPASDRYNLTICEILPASGGNGGGGTPTLPSVAMKAPAPGVVANLSTLWAVASDANGIAGVQFLLDGIALGSEVTASPYTTIWDTKTASAGSHSLAARARNTAGLTTTSAPMTVMVDNSGNSAVVGSWSSVVNIPAVAVNLVLLKNNKVLFYQDGSTPTVWDYLNGTFVSVPTTADIFCSGQALLADGRVLIVGGYGGSGSTIGIANAETFDPANNKWTSVPNMSFRRWYPGATTLSDGRILVTAGWQTAEHTNAGIPEIYDPLTNAWTPLTSANDPFETYPFLFLLSDGRVVHVGNSEFATVTDILDLKAQSWSVVDPNIVDGGSAAMYLPGKIMKAGSAADSQQSGPSANTTFLLDTTTATPAWQQTPSMVYPRSFLNLPVLPDGTVLAVGGETDKNGANIANAVYPAELWSPQTQTWATMAAMHTPREYHATALLLPDARVLVSGMGADFGNVPNEMNAEFYSPPYLFKGSRPSISQAPAQISYGKTFLVSTPDAAAIQTAVLIRTGAVTHFFDQNTCYVPLTFQPAAGGLTLSAPASANLAPPGYYMLFLVNTAGVPSIAPFVQLQ